jgi:hypothetical protein
MRLRPLTDPLSRPQMIQERIWSNGGMILARKNQRTQRKTCRSATVPTWTRLSVDDDIKTDLTETWCEDVNWIHVVQDGNL